MILISDVILAVAAFGAALYCHVLSRRLHRFSTLENGMGSAIALLSAQVDEMTRALERARLAANQSTARLDELTDRAEGAADRLELMLATLHDLPDPPEREERRRGHVVRRRSQRPLPEAAE